MLRPTDFTYAGPPLLVELPFLPLPASCAATEALADTWVTRKQADAQPPSPAQPQHGIYNLSPAGSPRLELAQRLLLEAAVRNGHAPHLYTKGEWIAGALVRSRQLRLRRVRPAPTLLRRHCTPAHAITRVPLHLLRRDFSQATGSAKDGDNVFLVTRGDLEVVEGGRGVDDNAGAGAGCKCAAVTKAGAWKKGRGPLMHAAVFCLPDSALPLADVSLPFVISTGPR